ncbi:RNA polymerase subunit AC19 [Coemansia sp. S610]|uniref:DNA-directed RNA polymerases I and III subunit RPAC2 n=1 Tax=Coemansia spiralis TaxID=417178 RepID=A0A9W8GKH6_9FUNG|nr:RNA polymerase subunit AC19 [Coemansia sp. RSA 2675]KAJ1997252.1 RNA polymerase subunit AC19 [Coemansia sp. S85]KAJ2032342.1 RNA polymerase subunit AC19 [Coemansia sp. S610]KAJ2368845.1 RNA polymerase subunit AC19 [Coemansia sp. RSA 2611]KAJ2416558.1 RNA polymerase subunit AC19 [Coemansia sp. RSA 2530]KAJ2687801.1 RNA polymerase subunit AC19 [Coemansia spiralis]KAJ2699096.1 RNA polymerase subunit AC19 [Coemansia sp. IMI 209128]
MDANQEKFPYIAVLEVPENKIEIVPGASSDLTSVTFSIKEEDHTLGNALRWCIMQNSQVDFCGYSIPHPSEAKTQVRIQTTDSTNAIDSMNKGLDDLKSACQLIQHKLHQRLAEGNFARTA